MDKEKLTDLVRNILEVALLIIALIRGIASGHWIAFIILMTVVAVIYGKTHVMYFGYNASDMVVHNFIYLSGVLS